MYALLLATQQKSKYLRLVNKFPEIKMGNIDVIQSNNNQGKQLFFIIVVVSMKKTQKAVSLIRVLF